MLAAVRESPWTVDDQEDLLQDAARGIQIRADDQGDLLRAADRGIQFQAVDREDLLRGAARGIQFRAADREDLLRGDILGIQFRACVPDALPQAAARDGADVYALDAGSRVDPDRRARSAAAGPPAAREADPDVSVPCRGRAPATGIASPPERRSTVPSVVRTGGLLTLRPLVHADEIVRRLELRRFRASLRRHGLGMPRLLSAGTEFSRTWKCHDDTLVMCVDMPRATSRKVRSGCRSMVMIE